MANPASSNNIKAGAFVLASIVLAVTIVITLAGLASKLQPSTPYVVRFSLADGAAGLEEGSEVRLGGRPIGAVASIGFWSPAGAAQPEAVDVAIRVRDRHELYSDAVAYLERPLLGSGGVLNLTSLGGADDAAPLPPGGVISGRPAAPSFLAQAGYGDEQAAQLQTVMANAAEVSERLNRVARDVEENMAPRARQTLDDAAAITGDVRSKTPEWTEQTDAFLDNLVATSEGARSRVDEAGDLIASIKAVVEENRPNIAAATDNFRVVSDRAVEIGERVNEEILTLVEDFLRDGRGLVAEADAAVEKVRSFVFEQTPSMRRSLANFLLASEQMKLTIGEVRRTPWRLLHRPDRKELEYELLYDSARTYAEAVSHLRAATESLEAVQSAGGDRLASGGRTTEELLDELTQAFERYRAAEGAFLDLLTAEAP